MNPLYTMERANMYCGSGPADGDASNHLSLTDVKLPGFDKATADHHPGGAPVAVEVPLQFNRLECTFQLLGLTPQVLSLVGSWTTAQNTFYIYGNIRDQITGQEAQAAALIKGILGRADPQNWTATAAHHTQYALKAIVHYEFQIAGDEIYNWDFAGNQMIVGGVDRQANTNQNLMIPNTTVAAGLGTTAGFTPGL